MATTVRTPIDEGEARESVPFEENFGTALFNRTLAACGLIVTSPLLAVVAGAVWLSDGRPMVFRQQRIGRGGVPFTLLKFRTMRRDNRGSAVTVAGDNRVTRVGRVLRKFKLDELPQLWNVVRGEMNLVGPRPEVAKYVDLTQPVWRQVLSVRPGITDVATLLFRDEERILAQYEDPEAGYRERVLPEKLSLNVAYLKVRSLSRDIRLLLLTARYSLLRGAMSEDRIRALIAK